MTVAEWCVFATVMLYLLTIVPVKWIGFRRYDNSKPRDPAFYDDPLRARALGAHQNGIEAFPFFAVAVIVAHVLGGPSALVNWLAVAFILVRIFYTGMYLTDRQPLRSASFFVGLILSIAIFLTPLFH